MRALLLAVLGGCSFSPGAFGSGGDAGGSNDDAPITDDAMSDGSMTDGAVDTPAPQGFVRRIDLADAQIAGTHTDFPLLVTLSADWLKSTANSGNVARADGFDIFFSSDQAGTTKLAFQFDRLDTTGGNLVAWVKLPTLTATTELYLHYGDPTITTTSETPAQVWTNGYELVLHMSDATDSTGKNAAGTAAGVGAAIGISGASSFDGTTSSIDVGSAAAIDNIFTGGGTVEGWFFADTFGENVRGRIFNKGDTAGWSLFLYDDSNGNDTYSFIHGGGSDGQWYGPNASVTLGAWHHIALTYDKGSSANNPTGYIDGVAQTMNRDVTPSGTMSDDSGHNMIIGNNGAAGSRTFDGNLDELRMSSSPRSADWIATQYRNQANPSNFYVVSAPL